MAWVDVCRGWIPIAYTFLLQGLQHALWKWKSYEKNRPFLGFILKVFCKQVQLGMVNNILKCIHICIIPEFLRWIPTIGAFKNHSGLFQHPFLVEKTWEIPWKILPWKNPWIKISINWGDAVAGEHPYQQVQCEVWWWMLTRTSACVDEHKLRQHDRNIQSFATEMKKFSRDSCKQFNSCQGPLHDLVKSCMAFSFSRDDLQ